MDLHPFYIPFGSIFPHLTSFLSSREKDYIKVHFPRINQRTPYGKAHRAVVAIERRISNLHLIMHRIRINSGVNILPNEKYSINFLYLPIDFESFFVWLRIIMDQVAYLTPFFYERSSIMPNKSFHDQKEWLINIKNSNFDRVYSKYISSNLDWFNKMRDTRDDSLHRHFWAYIDVMPEGRIKLNRMRGNKEEEIISSVAEVIGTTYVKFLNFSKFYENHFRKILLSRDKSFKYRQSSASMVSEYYYSLNHFVAASSVKLAS